MKLVTAQEMRALDKTAAESYGVPGLLLMENAAKAVADVAASMLNEAGGAKAVVVCGRGNNGGDGFGVARWLKSYGAQVKVLLVNAVESEITGDAAKELEILQKAGGEVIRMQTDEDAQLAEVICLKADLVVDAMLGTGFYGELTGMYKKMCAVINEAGRSVLSIDAPTGVNADSGAADAGAVRADVTVTLGLVKTGLLLYPAKEYVGKLLLAQIGFAQSMTEKCASKKYLLTREIVKDLLPLRKADAHKGDAGRVVVAAGSPGYTGAAALCVNGAVKAGAGLVFLLTPLSSREVLSVKLTEAMVHGLLERMPGVVGGGAAADVVQKANNADALAIGPGFGTAESTQEAVRDVLLKVEVPVVIDADALTALKGHTDILTQMKAPKALTPHSGEMARLLDKTVEEVNADRINIAVKYAQEWNAVIVLKGAPTIIGCPDGSAYINTTGCNAMATGGSGDTLTGIIAALAAQEISLQEAALCGAYLHGLAGELASGGAVGLAAGEIATALPQARIILEKDKQEEYIYNNALKMIK